MIFKSIKRFFLRSRSALVTLRATHQDVDFIFDLILLGVGEGHFNSGYKDKANHEGLREQIRCAIDDLPIPMVDQSRDGTGGKAFILMVQGQRAGFAIVLEDTPGSWHERIELFAVAIAGEHRGCGLAGKFVEWLLRSTRSQTIYARCFPQSKAMRAILGARGFTEVSTTPKGTTLFEFSRRRSVDTVAKQKGLRLHVTP